MSALSLALGVAAFCDDRDALKLWYGQPAGSWTQALPVGNGRLAAMVFGDLREERLQLNEDTVWSGEKRDRSNPEAQKAVPEIRRLLQEGHPAEAQRLADRAMISVPRALPVYQTLGDLWLDFGREADATNYRRELDLDTGIASVRYATAGVHYVREVFASAPARSIVVRLSADRPGSISFRATLTRSADARTEARSGRLIMTGQALPKKAPGEREHWSSFPRRGRRDSDRWSRGNRRATICRSAGADSVTLTIVAATDYREKDLARACDRDLTAASRRL